MHSLSRNIIKDTVIEKKTIINPPIVEKIYKDYALNQHSNSEMDIEDIYKKITNEANENRNKIIEEAKKEASEILTKAKYEAKLVKEEALVEKDKAFNEGKEIGYQEGYKLGYKDGYDYGILEANNEAERIRQKAEEYLKNCNEAVNTFIKEKEREIIELSINIARKIINTELSTSPEAVYKLAEKVLSKAMDKKRVIIKVNPRDFNYLKKRKDELAIYVEDPNNVIIVADSSISPGSIKAETPSGFLDGDIETQLDIILKSLLGEENGN